MYFFLFVLFITKNEKKNKNDKKKGRYTTTMLYCFHSSPPISFERIITGPPPLPAMMRFSGVEKVIIFLRFVTPRRLHQPHTTFQGFMLERKVQNEDVGERYSKSATECTTETDSKSKTAKFFFAIIKINSQKRYWCRMGVPEIRWTGGAKGVVVFVLFFYFILDSGLNLM